MSNAIKYLSMSFSSTIDFEVESLFDFEYLIWMVTISFFAYIYIYIYINWSTTFIIAMLQLSHISIHVINFFLSNFLIIVFNIYIFNIYTSPTFSLSLTFSFLHYFSFSPSLTYSTLHYPLHKYHSSSFSSSSLIFVSSYSHPLTINLLLSLSFYA